MNKTALTLFFMFVALTATALYFNYENRQLKGRIDEVSSALVELREINDRLRIGLESVQSGLDDLQTANELSIAPCDAQFPSGIYRLVTSTSYGPNVGSEFEIYHVSVRLAQWDVNVGTRVNAYGAPSDFYLEYDSDGRIDTALAARFVREIPVVGNSIADRLLTDSRVHQNLYSVFSCEWRSAQYTSVENMSDSVSGTSAMLWELVQANSARIIEWIGAD